MIPGARFSCSIVSSLPALRFLQVCYSVLRRATVRCALLRCVVHAVPCTHIRCRQKETTKRTSGGKNTLRMPFSHCGSGKHSVRVWYRWIDGRKDGVRVNKTACFTRHRKREFVDSKPSRTPGSLARHSLLRLCSRCANTPDTGHKRANKPLHDFGSTQGRVYTQKCAIRGRIDGGTSSVPAYR